MGDCSIGKVIKTGPGVSGKEDSWECVDERTKTDKKPFYYGFSGCEFLWEHKVVSSYTLSQFEEGECVPGAEFRIFEEGPCGPYVHEGPQCAHALSLITGQNYTTEHIVKEGNLYYKVRIWKNK